MNNIKIHSPMVTGSGAWILHEMLFQAINNYELEAINPYQASLPFLLTPNKSSQSEVIHSSPDLGPYILSKDAYKVLTFHNFYFDQDFMRYATLLQKMYYKNILKPSIIHACNKADVLVAVSDFIAQKIFENLPEFSDKVVIIKNGIDTSRFFPVKHSKSNQDKIKILYVGNISQRKGKQILFNLAKYLPKNCVLQITSGLRNSTIKRQANIELMGRFAYPEIHKLYQQADILFFPTIREGFGLCVAEAMACGLPVVTTNCSAIPELIDNQKGGFLCEANNLPQMLNVVKQVVNNSSLREDMGVYNREKAVKEFNSKRMIEEYQSVFSNSK